MKKILVFTTVCALLTTVSFTQTKKAKSVKKKVETTKTTIAKEPVKTEVANDNGNLVWYTNVFKADSVAVKTHKPIFGFFTGSDWCGWCHKLQRDVFAKPEFIKWAKEKVILLELDFPRRKQLPQEQQQQNYGLAQAFQVQGYPTIWLFNIVRDTSANIKLNPYGSLGYPSGAVQGQEEVTFLKSANEILAKIK